MQKSISVQYTMHTQLVQHRIQRVRSIARPLTRCISRVAALRPILRHSLLRPECFCRDPVRYERVKRRGSRTSASRSQAILGESLLNEKNTLRQSYHRGHKQPGGRWFQKLPDAAFAQQCHQQWRGRIVTSWSTRWAHIE